MKQTSLAILIIIASVLGILVLNSAYIVDQTEQVVITQFGEPMGEPIQDPGLHWKVPFIQLTHKLLREFFILLKYFFHNFIFNKASCRRFNGTK